jgi:4-hydroxythreonine-4-phosphate dehydrogenase
VNTGDLPLALTPGEPAGIAPEITAKAWLALRDHPTLRFFLIGDLEQYRARAASAGIPLEWQDISSPEDAVRVFPTALPVLHLPFSHKSVAGHLDQRNAGTVIAAIDDAVSLCLSGQAGAIVTNPIQKETLYGAGFTFQGHTDYLGHLARKHGHDAHDVMMLVAGDLKAVPLTVHIPLSKVPAAITAEEIMTQAHIVHRDLQRYFNFESPRLAVSGLNPHAGENGAMGDEERSIIEPAIVKLRGSGINVVGPLPADTAFHEEARKTYDAIICMYHDQALIPAKTIDFHGGVNVTLGLPFIRTSPDHGTALRIAGTGTANPTSLIAALKLAHQMALNSAAS